MKPRRQPKNEVPRITTPRVDVRVFAGDVKRELLRLAAKALSLRNETEGYVAYLDDHRQRLLRERLDALVEDFEQLFA